MISTIDCKLFLSDLALRGIIAPDKFEKADHAKFIQAAIVPNNWKRAEKCLPRNSQYTISNCYSVLQADGTRRQEPKENFVVERKFFCAPEIFEDAIAYLVLERPNSTLALGDEVGD